MKKANWRWQLLSPVFAVLLWLADQSVGLYDRVEFTMQDMLLQQEARRHQPPADVVLIDIDQQSLDAMNPIAGTYPWPRSVLAEVVEGVESAGAEAIVFDLFFNEADTFRADSDALFRDTLSRHSNIYVPTLLLSEGHGAPLQRLQQRAPGLQLQGQNPGIFAPLLLPLVLNPQSWRGGIANVPVDPDGVERRFALYAERFGWRIPSLGWRIDQDLHWPQPVQSPILLHWYQAGWQRYSFSDVYLSLEQRQSPGRHLFSATATAAVQPDLSGKIVLLGITAPGLSTLHATPMGTQTQPLDIVATLLANLKHGDWLYSLALRPWLGGGLLLLLLWVFWQEWPFTVLLPVLLLASALPILLGWVLLHEKNTLLIGLSGVAMAWTLFIEHVVLIYIRWRWQRQQAEMLLLRFLDPAKVAVAVQSSATQALLQPHFRQVTLLYAQLRGIDKLQSASATETLEVLNQFLLRQAGVLFSTHATLESWSGGWLRALWNAPMDDAGQAWHAVEAALSLNERADLLLGEWGQDKNAASQKLELRIAVHVGKALVGFLGTEDRLEYTAIGPVVDQTYALLSQTTPQNRLLVSAEVRQACADRFEFKEVHSPFLSAEVFPEVAASDRFVPERH